MSRPKAPGSHSSPSLAPIEGAIAVSEDPVPGGDSHEGHDDRPEQVDDLGPLGKPLTPLATPPRAAALRVRARPALAVALGFLALLALLALLLRRRGCHLAQFRWHQQRAERRWSTPTSIGVVLPVPAYSYRLGAPTPVLSDGHRPTRIVKKRCEPSSEVPSVSTSAPSSFMSFVGSGSSGAVGGTIGPISTIDPSGLRRK